MIVRKSDGTSAMLVRVTDPVVDRLLRSDEPSIRWKTRLNALGDDPSSRAMKRLRDEIRTSPRARALLSQRTRNVYMKWQGLHWVLAALADMGYPEGDKTLVPLRDRVLAVWTGPSYTREFVAKTQSAAYTGGRGVPLVDGRYRRCGSQHGSALLSVLRLGIADERVEWLADRLMHWQWPDGGWNCDRHLEAHVSSFNETLFPMRALELYGRTRGNRRARAAAKRAADVFLKRRLLWRVRDGRVMQTAFAQLHYPRYWHYDVLAGLVGMAELGLVNDRRCGDALSFLERKRLSDGGWPAEARYYRVTRRTLGNSGEYVDWGPTGKTRMNEWVTVDALTVLAAARRL